MSFFAKLAEGRAQHIGDGERKERKMKRSGQFNLLPILVVLVFLGALGCGILPSPGAEVEIEFWASEEIVAPGGCTVLHWRVEGGEGYPVFLDGEEVPASGEDMVCVEETTTFSLIVAAPGETYEGSVTVFVSGTPGVEPMASPPGPLLGTPVPTATPTNPPSPPPPTQAPPTATRMPPTATSAPPPPPPAAPRIVYFRANGTDGSITVAPGTTVTLSWEWERVSEGYLDPGNVPMVCPAMPCTFQVAPPATTTYTLRAVNPSGTDTKSVTVEISPGGDVPPGGGEWGVTEADLAITDLYVQGGTVYGRITSNGPDSMTDMPVEFSCDWARTGYGDAFGVRDGVGPQRITIISLSPGQTIAFSTSISVDLHQFWYDMTCTLIVDFNDPNPGNNSYQETLAI
jgi:hypothetical protein